jgi:hypothetical protein
MVNTGQPHTEHKREAAAVVQAARAASNGCQSLAPQCRAVTCGLHSPRHTAKLRPLVQARQVSSSTDLRRPGERDEGAATHTLLWHSEAASGGGSCRRVKYINRLLSA